MPAAAKSPLSSKNPAAVARKMYAGPGIVGGNGNGGHVEVVCPLLNADGSMCRKKCVGNFAYRSICEHIRRAHPDNWIPKLPASPETFEKMVNQSPRANAPAAGAQFHLRKPPLHTPHVHQQHSQLAVAAVFRKMGKSLKREDDQYMEGLSPPSSANESEPPSLPPISLSTGVSFQSKLPSPPGMSDYDVRDDDEFGHVEDDDARSSVVSRSTSSGSGGGAGFQHGLTTKLVQDTEDDSDDAIHRRPSHRPQPPNHHHHHQQLLLHHHHHHHRQLPSPHAIRPSKSSAGVKRKRVAYAASNPETSPSAGGGGGSTDNSSSQSSAASRWDELIEAATNRAVAIDPQQTFRHHSHHHHHHTPQTPLSPPATASSSSYTPTIAPPSASATPPSSTTPSEFAALSTPRKLVCATCEGATPVNMAFACTECMSGFCDECAFGAGRRGSCGECRAVGGKFKPLRIIVR